MAKSDVEEFAFGLRVAAMVIVAIVIGVVIDPVRPTGRAVFLIIAVAMMFLAAMIDF